MKYSQWIGILAAITLVIACFIPGPTTRMYKRISPDSFLRTTCMEGRENSLSLFAAIAAVFFFDSTRMGQTMEPFVHRYHSGLFHQVLYHVHGLLSWNLS